MTALYDKLRPKTFDEVVGYDKIKKRLCIIRENLGFAGQVFWFTGPSGSGKTTLSRIIASEVSSEWATIEIDAQDVTIDMVRQWETDCQRPPLDCGCYSFIINEAHGLSNRVVSRLQTTLESPGVQKRGTFCFTTTYQGQRLLFENKFDSVPFLSRAVCFDLMPDAETSRAMAKYLQTTARSLNLDGKPIKDYQNLFMECSANMRQALQKIASGAMME